MIHWKRRETGFSTAFSQAIKGQTSICFNFSIYPNTSAEQTLGWTSASFSSSLDSCWQLCLDTELSAMILIALGVGHSDILIMTIIYFYLKLQTVSAAGVTYSGDKIPLQECAVAKQTPVAAAFLVTNLTMCPPEITPCTLYNPHGWTDKPMSNT